MSVYFFFNVAASYGTKVKKLLDTDVERKGNVEPLTIWKI